MVTIRHRARDETQINTIRKKEFDQLYLWTGWWYNDVNLLYAINSKGFLNVYVAIIKLAIQR